MKELGSPLSKPQLYFFRRMWMLVLTIGIRDGNRDGNRWTSPQVIENSPERVQGRSRISSYRCTDASATLFQQLILARRGRKVSALVYH